MTIRARSVPPSVRCARPCNRPTDCSPIGSSGWSRAMAAPTCPTIASSRDDRPRRLDQAAPLAGWHLPEEFATLRRLIEARMGKRGKREFVQVLRLLEVFRAEDVLAGVREAMVRGVIGFDAVKHLVLCRIEHRPPRLDLTVYPYLPRARVATTSAEAYMALLSGARS